MTAYTCVDELCVQLNIDTFSHKPTKDRYHEVLYFQSTNLVSGSVILFGN